MRVMTWNIRTGGEGRLDDIAAVISSAAPDLLALQELRGFHRHMPSFAARLGMHPVLARSMFGQPVAVLSRLPVLRGRTVRWRLHHAAASATVRTGRGELTLVSTHLNPFHPGRRAREATWLARGLARPDGLLLLAGDLNALAPDTDHTDRLDRLHPMFRRRHLTRDGAPDTGTIAALYAAGFHDLWHGPEQAGRTAPTTAGGGREFSGMRLDYILASPALAALARSCTVLRGGATEHASDHYPVVADLDL